MAVLENTEALANLNYVLFFLAQSTKLYSDTNVVLQIDLPSNSTPHRCVSKGRSYFLPHFPGEILKCG